MKEMMAVSGGSRIRARMNSGTWTVTGPNGELLGSGNVGAAGSAPDVYISDGPGLGSPYPGGHPFGGGGVGLVQLDINNLPDLNDMEAIDGYLEENFPDLDFAFDSDGNLVVTAAATGFFDSDEEPGRTNGEEVFRFGQQVGEPISPDFYADAGAFQGLLAALGAFTPLGMV